LAEETDLIGNLPDSGRSGVCGCGLASLELAVEATAKAAADKKLRRHKLWLVMAVGRLKGG
jgi:hypothetical protein